MVFTIPNVPMTWNLCLVHKYVAMFIVVYNIFFYRGKHHRLEAFRKSNKTHSAVCSSWIHLTSNVTFYIWCIVKPRTYAVKLLCIPKSTIVQRPSKKRSQICGRIIPDNIKFSVFWALWLNMYLMGSISRYALIIFWIIYISSQRSIMACNTWHSYMISCIPN